LPALEPSARFDAVFLDPFSPSVESALWEAPFLFEIARRMRAGAWLSTYTVSLPVRARLVAAGLRVGPGERVGAKSSGTVASPDQDPGTLAPRASRRVSRLAAHIRGEFAPLPGTRDHQ
jgi:tRNA U34 5-methylaminomethyl-2-thiouridine-forming methyltransferase MnmC